MTVEYLAYQLIAGYGKDSNVTSYVDNYDFYLIPVVNPDGFVYSQTQDRLWRKNRAPPLPGANTCLLYTSPSPRDRQKSRMPSSA